MTTEELRTALEQVRGNLFDIEDMHSFTFGKTSVHIGAEKTQNIQLEFEEECKMYNEQIGAIEKALNARGSLQTVPRLAISQEANTNACS